MPTFERCDSSVEEMADEILKRYETHAATLNAKVRVDYVFAIPELDEDGNPVEIPIKHHGIRALGVCRKIPLKDRALGRGDAEIMLDWHWWQHVASEGQQEAVPDHELHHIEVKMKHGCVQLDALSRPMIVLRKHDFDFGWFTLIAERHGASSIERKQAKFIMERSGQFYWPELAPAAQKPTDKKKG